MTARSKAPSLLAPLAAALLLVAAGGAGAQTPPAAATPGAPAASGAPATQRAPSAAQEAQQQRMRDCTAQAGERNLAGDARRSFMSDCLAGRVPATAAPPAAAASSTTPAAPATQQDRMRSCNAQAGERNLAGDARRNFMSDCLAGRDGPAAAAPR